MNVFRKRAVRLFYKLHDGNRSLRGNGVKNEHIVFETVDRVACVRKDAQAGAGTARV